MGEIIVHRGQETYRLVNRPPLLDLTKAEWVQDLMQVDTIELSLDSQKPINFILGDYLIHNNRIFKLNFRPLEKKANENLYNYTVKFEGIQYELGKKIFFNLDSNGFQTTADFSLVGKVEMFMHVLVNNANQLGGDFTWVVGEFPETDTKILSFASENCLQVLQKLCKEFVQEYDIEQNLTAKTNTLHIRKAGGVIDYPFEHGRGNGLYTLERQSIGESAPITRLYALGSTENLPMNYRGFSTRLKPRDIEYYETSEKIDKYGVNEGVKIYEDVKPTFNGKISSVGTLQGGVVSFVSPDIDFDLKASDTNGSIYLIAGITPKISVRKGNLTGYEFEITSFDYPTKTFTVKQFTNDIGQLIPNDSPAFQFAVNDEFTILGIALPQQYVDAAENKLRDIAIEEYKDLSAEKVKFNLNVEPEFFDLKNLVPKIGDEIPIKDSAMNIDEKLRITSITQNLLKKNDYKFEVSERYKSIKSIIDTIYEVVKNPPFYVPPPIPPPVVVDITTKESIKVRSLGYYGNDDNEVREALQSVIIKIYKGYPSGGEVGQDYQYTEYILKGTLTAYKHSIGATAYLRNSAGENLEDGWYIIGSGILYEANGWDDATFGVSATNVVEGKMTDKNFLITM